MEPMSNTMQVCMISEPIQYYKFYNHLVYLSGLSYTLCRVYR